jgi:hypothetical protein
MYRLIIEHIIRRILQEEEFTNLGIGSFRGASHTDRTNKFIKYLSSKKPTPITFKDGKKEIVTSVKIIKKGEKKPTEYDPKTQAEELKLILPKLKAGDKLYLVGASGVEHSITTVVKTLELGGKGKGYQRGSKAEATEIANIQKQIDEFKPAQGGITIVGAGGGIVGIEPVAGNKKADFKFVDEAGNAVAYIQHKSPKHQQMSGVGRDPIRGFKEVQVFAQDVFKVVSESPEKRLEGPYSKAIQDDELKRLAVYGDSEGGPKGVQFYCIGPMELRSLGDNEFKLTIPEGKGRVYTDGQIPDGNEAPTLVATYRAGRNQRVPGSRDVIPDTRIGIYPKNYVSNS